MIVQRLAEAGLQDAAGEIELRRELGAAEVQVARPRRARRVGLGYEHALAARDFAYVLEVRNQLGVELSGALAVRRFAHPEGGYGEQGERRRRASRLSRARGERAAILARPSYRQRRQRRESDKGNPNVKHPLEFVEGGG